MDRNTQSYQESLGDPKEGQGEYKESRKMTTYATVEDLKTLWRPLSNEEEERAGLLLETVSDALRTEAYNRGVDLDLKAEKEGEFYRNTLRSVTVDVTARVLMTSTDSEPLQSSTESALGYSVSATYLIPGGGLFIKRSELKRLGLLKQKVGSVELYDLPGPKEFPWG
jgi:hypothetical protein